MLPVKFFEGQSHAACSKCEIGVSGFSLLGLVLFWLARQCLLAFNDLFAGHLLSMKIKKVWVWTRRRCNSTEDKKNSTATRGHKPEIFQVTITCQNLLAPFSPSYIESALLFISLQDAHKSLFTPARKTQVFCSASFPVAEQTSTVLFNL